MAGIGASYLDAIVRRIIAVGEALSRSIGIVRLSEATVDVIDEGGGPYLGFHPR
jgi:hypothetical protein